MDLIKTLELVNKAAQHIQLVKAERINQMLLDLADEAEKEIDFILTENQKDLDRMPKEDPKYDRLQLTESRIKDIASDIRNVSSLPSPLGKTLTETTTESGLQIKRTSVPIGVIGIIYEARPNVTFDVFSLCIKSGNACVLKGGSDAEYSNIAITGIIHRILEKHDIDKSIVVQMPADRETTTELLKQDKYLDMIIPRGSQGLIDHVRKTSSIPVIETGAGICHTYFDKHGDLDKGREIAFNAKTRRVSVCNALDCLVVHEDRLNDLAELVKNMASEKVTIFADEKAYAALEGEYEISLLQQATEDSFGTEFLSHKMSIKVVDDIKHAIEHITQYSSKHSEAIVSEDQASIDLFFTLVDAAAVYANTSTAFTDGAQFGLGAEIGISTQKLHARGPMALDELTSYKWIIVGNGQVRGK